MSDVAMALLWLGIAFMGGAWLFFALWRAERRERNYWVQEYDRWRERYFDLLADTNAVLRQTGNADRQLVPRVHDLGNGSVRIDPWPSPSDSTPTEHRDP